MLPPPPLHCHFPPASRAYCVPLKQRHTAAVIAAPCSSCSALNAELLYAHDTDTKPHTPRREVLYSMLYVTLCDAGARTQVGATQTYTGNEHARVSLMCANTYILVLQMTSHDDYDDYYAVCNVDFVTLASPQPHTTRHDENDIADNDDKNDTTSDWIHSGDGS